MDNVDLIPEKHLKFLRLAFGANDTFGCHVTSAIKIAETKVKKFHRLMSSIGSASSGRRQLLLLGVMQSVLLYGAPVWCSMLEKTQEKVDLGLQNNVDGSLAGDYRNVADSAADRREAVNLRDRRRRESPQVAKSLSRWQK